MVVIEEIEDETIGRSWLSLSEKVMERLDLEVGDWILLRREDGEIIIEGVDTKEITIDIDTELYERALLIRDLEGYYTLEEALPNMVRDGLAGLLEERGEEEEAEKYRNSWLLRIHYSYRVFKPGTESAE